MKHGFFSKVEPASGFRRHDAMMQHIDMRFLRFRPSGIWMPGPILVSALLAFFFFALLPCFCSKETCFFSARHKRGGIAASSP